MHPHWQMYLAPMAATSKLVISVDSSRGASTITYSSKGRYVSFPTNGLAETLTGQPIMPTTSLEAFWTAVLAIVQTSITALE